MKKHLYLLLTLCLCAAARLSAQCAPPDTTHLYRVRTRLPCGIAFSGSRAVVTSYNPDTYGSQGTVKLWRQHYLFTIGAEAQDSFKLTAPGAAAFDTSGNLYVVQTERPDSNIMIYNSAYALIKVIDNAPGATHWCNPRGIAFDAAGSLYVVSQDSTTADTARTDIPNTGRLIKIDDPLGAATRTTLLSGLNNPKGIAIKDGSLYLTEYGANRVVRYNAATMAATDSIAITHPIDLAADGCKLYCTEQGTHTVIITDTAALHAGITEEIYGFDSVSSPAGIAFDGALNIFISDTKNDRVVFFEKTVYPIVDYPLYCLHNYFTFRDSTLAAGSSALNAWKSSDTTIAVIIDTTGLIYTTGSGLDTIFHYIGTDTIVNVILSANCNYNACLHSTIGLYDAPPLADTAYTSLWASSDTAVGTIDMAGNFHAVSLGTTNITHIAGDYSFTFPMAVLDITGPSAGSIYTYTDTGVVNDSFTFCKGNALQLFNDTASGIWTSSNPGIAYVDNYGVVWPKSAGTATIYYTVGNYTCYSSAAGFTVTIQDYPDVGNITGSDTICRGSTAILSDAAGAGTWSSADTAIAQVDSTGLVTVAGAGATAIFYTKHNTCGPYAATHALYADTIHIHKITGAAGVCVMAAITLSDSSAGGSWSSSDATVAVDATGTVRGIAAGSAVITYTAAVDCGIDTTYDTITVCPQPHAGIITGADSVCLYAAVMLADIAPGGRWVSSTGNTSVSAGSITGLSAGTDTILYIVSNLCKADTARHIIKITSTPAVAITGYTAALCMLASTTLTASAPGGVWGAANATATVAGGVVTGVSAGGNTISYTVTNSCGSSTAIYPITIDGYPDAGTIYGYPELCISDAEYFFADGDAGGTWSISDASVAAIDPLSGLLTPAGAGTATIQYTATNTCSGEADAYFDVTIDTAPDSGAITASSTAVCIGSSITFSETISSGVWSAANAHAAVSGGIVTGITAGIDTIIFSTSNACGTTATSQPVTIAAPPVAGSITGAAAVCTGVPVALTDAAAGGGWSSSSPLATVAGGVVTGISAGTDTITYSVTNVCGTVAATHIINITLTPDAGIITGAVAELCAGTSIALIDDAPGGIWSAENTTATVAGGVVTGVSAGNNTISYTITNSCGSSTAIYPVTIDAYPNAGTIYGFSEMCVTDAGYFYSDGDAGGIWSVLDATLATIDPSSGYYTPAAAGTETVQYSVSNACGAADAYSAVIMDAAPVAGAITGPADTVCSGTSITLTDAAGGGTWGAANASATVASGVVTGVSAGIDTIFYSVANACGTAAASRQVTVLAAPYAGAITGAAAVCTGAAVTLSAAAPGGTWLSSNASAAVSSVGVATGTSAGTDTIMYLVTNGCGTDTAMHIITIYALPGAGSIAGPATACIGSAATLTDAAPGGVWTAVNSRASVSAGAVSGVAAGSDTILYIVTNTCGADTAAYPITVSPLPYAGAVSGAATVCQDVSVTLTAAVSGGTWTATNSNASLAGGVATGITAGADTILYLLANACGTDTARRLLTVLPRAYAGVITGAAAICSMSPVTLSDAVAGGTWAATGGHTAVSAGIATGISYGIDTIRYIVINSCGADTAIHIITVAPLPVAGVITGAADTVCTGTSITLADTAASGIWTSSNARAITSSGRVTGISAGADTIIYAVSNACGTATAAYPIIVADPPAAGTISGPDSLCQHAIVTLTDAAAGGVWGVSNANAAVAAGVVTGRLAGGDTVTYTVVNACGTARASHAVYVRALGPAGTISGPDTICAGGSTTLTETVTTGIWALTNNHAVMFSGIVIGETAGLDTAVYITLNACGADSAMHPMVIDTVPPAGIITGTDTLCPGDTAAFADSAVAMAGTWTTSNAVVAAISTTGVVTAVSPGTATISFSLTNRCGTGTATRAIDVRSGTLCVTLHTANTVIAAGALKVYPNPNNGLFTISLSSDISEAVSFSVINMLGEKVYEAATVSNKETAVHLSPAAGIYFVYARTAHGTYVVKVVVE